MRLIRREELRQKMERGDEFKLLITLPPAYRTTHIPGSLHFETVEQAVATLHRDDEIVVYCANVNCAASIYAYRLFEREGFTRIRRYAGGVADWEGAGCPLERNAGHRASDPQGDVCSGIAGVVGAYHRSRRPVWRGAWRRSLRGTIRYTLGFGETTREGQGVGRSGWVVSGLLAVVCVSLLAAGGGSAAPVPLVIAVEGPQSGSQAANGLDQLRGVRLAVAQLDKSGGLWNGRKVTVFAADDKGDAADATAVAQRVIGRGIRFEIGPYNSSVGIANLPLYRKNHVLPVWMTSRDETAGAGATVQPMNTQIAPVEAAYLRRLGVRKVAMLVDDTANGAFTKGVAESLRAALEQDGATVTWTSIQETTEPGLPGNYYAAEVAQALATNPDFVYVSTYFPEGLEIAKALAASGSTPRCLMGLANVDNGFLAGMTLTEAQRCVFSGVPAATEMPSARTYVRQYRSKFGSMPGVWGSFTYDSARILFAAIDKAKSLKFTAVERALRTTRGYRGATGTITINPKTGYRATVPVSILRVDASDRFVIAK